MVRVLHGTGVRHKQCVRRSAVNAGTCGRRCTGCTSLHTLLMPNPCPLLCTIPVIAHAESQLGSLSKGCNQDTRCCDPVQFSSSCQYEPSVCEMQGTELQSTQAASGGHTAYSTSGTGKTSFGHYVQPQVTDQQLLVPPRLGHAAFLKY